jgi:hypothetical protein
VFIYQLVALGVITFKRLNISQNKTDKTGKEQIILTVIFLEPVSFFYKVNVKVKLSLCFNSAPRHEGVLGS